MKPPLYLCLYLMSFALSGCTERMGKRMTADGTEQRPNILFAIADDQSYPYTTAYGDRTTLTPAFDVLAARGVLFTNAFCAAPQCSPSRAALLTGRNIWELEEAGTHSSYFPRKFQVFTDLLEETGYTLGYTGKPWGPGNWQDAGWDRNPVGPAYNEHTLEPPYNGISNKDYASNFSTFLAQKDSDRPFFFWYGGHEPHRRFESGSGRMEGKQMQEANVPDFLPDDEVVRDDILDYSVEIEWFDQHLGQMIAQLEARGELENTIIVVTADNGMAFPYAKANLQEYGTHVPLVIAGPGINGARQIEDLVSLIDLAPTFLQLSGAPPLDAATGKSLARLLRAEAKGDPHRNYVFTGRERHTHARPDNLGYPARAVRSEQYLYIHNFRPDRWPAGDPAVALAESEATAAALKSMKDGYHDIDACPSKTLLLEQQDKYRRYFDLAVAKRPAEELYDIGSDPGCTKNLAEQPAYEAVRKELKSVLFAQLKKQRDPRVLDGGDVFESYPRFGGMRAFPGFKERTKYNPAYQKRR